MERIAAILVGGFVGFESLLWLPDCSALMPKAVERGAVV